jgi:hypothetical protein
MADQGAAANGDQNTAEGEGEPPPEPNEPPPEPNEPPPPEPRGSAWHRNWEVRAAIAGAAISVVGGGAVSAALAIMDHSEPTISTGAGGSISQVAVNGDSLGLTVSGRADPGIRSIVVIVGPRSAAENRQFWAAETSVGSDETWSLAIDTPPSLSLPFNLSAYFNTGSSYNGLVPPSQRECLELRGPACIEWAGAPATYTSRP